MAPTRRLFALLAGLFLAGCGGLSPSLHPDPYPGCMAEGFDTGLTDWSLPSRGGSDDPVQWQDSGATRAFTCAHGESGAVTWDLRDLTGDAVPDLVVYVDGCDTTVGTDHWDVYAAQTWGFAPTPTPWALPRRDESCLSSPVAWTGATGPDDQWTVRDLTGDGIPDLVVLHDPCDASVSVDHWDVYPGSSTGFAAAPIHWDLPARGASGDPERWTVTASPYGCAGGGTGTITWSLLDTTGLGRLDLVVTRDGCDPSVSLDHWDMYPNDGSGFEALSVSWLLPRRGPPSAPLHWPAVAGTGTRGCGDGTTGQVSWRLFQGPQRGPTLVVQSDTCDPEVSVGHWDAYVGSAPSFASSPVRWILPQRGSASDPVHWGPSGTDDYTCATGGHGRIAWVTADLTGQGYDDLVVVHDDCQPDVATDHWDVYRGGPFGFSVPPEAWTLPSRDPAGDPITWPSLEGTENTSCGTGGSTGHRAWWSVPFDAGLWFDLVVHDDTCDPKVGSDHWDVYRSSVGCY